MSKAAAISTQPLGLHVDYATLRVAIAWAQRSVTAYGKLYPQPRLTRWYGDVPYFYSGLAWEASPMPEPVARIMGRVQDMTGERFSSVLCNLYRNGRDCVGWHADDEPLFGPDPVVASVSFGATRTFKMRRNDKAEALDFNLEDGSLLVMGRGTQPSWKHCITKTAKPVGERINLTFRLTV